MDVTSKVEALLGVIALASTIAMFLVTYSWADPQNGYFSLQSADPEPIRTLGILVLIIAAISVVHGFFATSFFQMALGTLILVWMVFVLAWFFPGTVGQGHYNFLVDIRVTFTHDSLLLYSSIGITLEIMMIAHGIYKGKKGEYEPEEELSAGPDTHGGNVDQHELTKGTKVRTRLLVLGAGLLLVSLVLIVLTWGKVGTVFILLALVLAALILIALLAPKSDSSLGTAPVPQVPHYSFEGQ